MELTDFCGVEVGSDLDRRVMSWLVSTLGADKIAAAVAKIPAGQRRFPSTVVRVLGVEVPPLVRMSPEEIEDERAKGNAARAKMRAMVADFRAKEKSGV